MLIVFGMLPALGGCSSFNRDWNRMERIALAETEPMQTPSGPLAGMLGRWQGEWRSDANGHHGKLRCIITRGDGADLHARYRARYGWFFTFDYDMPMAVEHHGATYHFSASADLGWLAGGEYQYDGTVTGDTFHATYESSGDHGTFEMTRVVPDEQNGS